MALRESSDGENKAELILQAAQRLFSRYGYRRTSVEDVAREAGVAKGTVYLYFKSKEELFFALSKRVVEEIFSRVEAALKTKGSLEERLFGLLEAKFVYLFEIVHSSAHARDILDSKNRISAGLFREADRRYHALLREEIFGADQRGELSLSRLGLDADSAAALIIRCAYGARSDAEETNLSARGFRRRLEELVRVLVAGLRVGRSLGG